MFIPELVNKEQKMYSGQQHEIFWFYQLQYGCTTVYAIFSYWCWFANLSCLIWSADSFLISSFWYQHWLNSLFSLHSANSFAIFCLCYWDWVASLFVQIQKIHLHIFFSSLDSALSFALLLFSYSHLARVQLKAFASF